MEVLVQPRRGVLQRGQDQELLAVLRAARGGGERRQVGPLDHLGGGVGEEGEGLGADESEEGGVECYGEA